jgi:hypothetical protein
MKEASSPRYTVAWWSGHCHGPGATTLQPRSQLAATIEVCFDVAMTSGSFGSKCLHAKSNLKFTRPSNYLLLS